MQGVPSPITSIGELTELITTFIFMASVGHASANFCQYDEYAYPPNYPAQLIGERPKNKVSLGTIYGNEIQYVHLYIDFHIRYVQFSHTAHQDDLGVYESHAWTKHD